MSMAYNGDWTPPPEVVERRHRRAQWRVDAAALIADLRAEYEREYQEIVTAWLSGAPDVSMGISYEMKGWGDAEH